MPEMDTRLRDRLVQATEEGMNTDCPKCGKVLTEVLTTDPPQCPHCRAPLPLDGLTAFISRLNGQCDITISGREPITQEQRKRILAALGYEESQ